MKTYYMNMKIGNILVVWESAGCPRSHGSNKLGYVIFTHNKSTFARPKKIKHWFLYFQKTVFNNYTKEIFAKQVAT